MKSTLLVALALALGACDPNAFGVRQGPCGELSRCPSGESCWECPGDRSVEVCALPDDDLEPICAAAGAAEEPVGPCTSEGCDDGNVCTRDYCDDNDECAHYHNDAATCDDGLACTVDDFCVVGACVGTKQECQSCGIDAEEPGAKVFALALSSDGKPGSGLDVDGDPETCQPSGDCGGGVDNVLGPLSYVVNDAIVDSLANGALAYVFDLSKARLDGTPFDLVIYDVARVGDSCDFQSPDCEWRATQAGFDGACQPYFAIDAARIEGSKLDAGGVDAVITLVVKLDETTNLPMTIAQARITADLTLEGGAITKLRGIIAGAVPKSQLIKAIQNLGDDVLPIDKTAAATLLDNLIENDIDLDRDGERDAVSIGLTFETVPGTLVP